jgi:hypothetical protein
MERRAKTLEVKKSVMYCCPERSTFGPANLVLEEDIHPLKGRTISCRKLKALVSEIMKGLKTELCEMSFLLCRT